MKVISKIGIAAAFSLLSVNGVMAAEKGFDPNKSCIGILKESDSVNRAMVASWAFGFLSADPTKVRKVSIDNIVLLLANLEDICGRDPQKTLLQVVRETAGVTSVGEPSGPAAGSEAEARAMLMKFYEPGADFVALTAALLPSESDVHAVYHDPLASKMAVTYAAAFKPGISFKPKPEHSDIYMFYSNTSNLRGGTQDLNEFPGGYKKVIQYMKPGIPIVRFKFVKKGETSGLAFDGLVYVDGRWTLLPKPWRSLDN